MTDNLKTPLRKAACLMGLEVEWNNIELQWFCEDTLDWFNPFLFKDQLVDLEEALDIDIWRFKDGLQASAEYGECEFVYFEFWDSHDSKTNARVTAVLRCAAAYYDVMQEKKGGE